LATGRKYLDFSNGHVATVSEGVHTILASSGPAPGITVGIELPLSGTYCKHTLGESGIYVIPAASESMTDDPAYDESALEAYAGTTIRADGMEYGTLCFINNDEPIARLSDWQHTLFEHLAQWIKTEAERDLAVDTHEQSKRLLRGHSTHQRHLSASLSLMASLLRQMNCFSSSSTPMQQMCLESRLGNRHGGTTAILRNKSAKMPLNEQFRVRQSDLKRNIPLQMAPRYQPLLWFGQ